MRPSNCGVSGEKDKEQISVSQTLYPQIVKNNESFSNDVCFNKKSHKC